MPQYTYRGRDREGNLRVGQRFAHTIDNLNNELSKEGIFPLEIVVAKTKRNTFDLFRDWLQGKSIYLEELAVFARQMQLLHKAGVPVETALRQLVSFTHSHRLSHALQGVIDQLDKGQSLASAMQQFPEAFSPLVVSIVEIGESTGHLDQAFGHLYRYLEFESTSFKQFKSAFRYPTVVLISILGAIITLNIFVIPTFGNFYANAEVNLPWQTRLLIGSSNFFVNYGLYVLILSVIGLFFFINYLRKPTGRYKWDRFLLKLPLIGKLLRRIILIRFSQSLAIVLESGIPLNQGLSLIKNVLENSYIDAQVADMQQAIERGNTFSQAITKVDLFSSMELQILAVGEKNGELAPALTYIGNFHTHEIQFDLKRMNDLMGPILITFVSVLILIIALGIYLPIWNMVNLVH